LQAGQLDEAEAIYQQALTVEGCHAPSLHALGMIAFRRGEYARAIDLVELSLVEQPDNAEALAHLAAALQNGGRAEEAIAQFEKALARRPDDPETHHNLGTTLRSLGRLDEAIGHYRRALDLKPNYAEALSGVAVVLLDQGKRDDAIAHLRQAVVLRPENAEAHNNLGVVLMGHGRLEEAIARYEHALALKPDYADAQMNYGTALYEQGRISEALARFRRAVAVQPDHVDAILKLAAALGTELEVDEITALLERTIELKPDLGFARLALCMAQVPILYRDEAEIAPRRAAYRKRLEQLCRDHEEGRVPGNLADAAGSTQPFYLAYQGYNDRELQTLYGGLICRAVAAAYPAAPMPSPLKPGEKVRVGIVAGLFRHHTVWKLMIRGWLTQLDRRKFEVFGYHTSDAQDELTGLARQLCNRFVQRPADAGALARGDPRRRAACADLSGYRHGPRRRPSCRAPPGAVAMHVVRPSEHERLSDTRLFPQQRHDGAARRRPALQRDAGPAAESRLLLRAAGGEIGCGRSGRTGVAAEQRRLLVRSVVVQIPAAIRRALSAYRA
jgi:tetratricopeptide (TPR) repeat protein